MNRTAAARNLNRYFVEPTGCWHWTGFKCPLGYGKVPVRLEDGRVSSTNAHRLFYEFHVAWIQPGLQLDHLCRNTSCVNPEHLEPVTNGENIWRAIQDTRPTCPSGHEFTPENTRYDGHTRRCRTCLRERDKLYKRKVRPARAAKVREINRAYYAANREKLVERERERRAARKAAG